MKRMLIGLLAVGAFPVLALADGEPKAAEVQTNLNVVWTLIAAVLVFMMQAGFALVETGFTRAKNAANIMMKNLMEISDLRNFNAERLPDQVLCAKRKHKTIYLFHVIIFSHPDLRSDMLGCRGQVLLHARVYDFRFLIQSWQ